MSLAYSDQTSLSLPLHSAAGRSATPSNTCYFLGAVKISGWEIKFIWGDVALLAALDKKKTVQKTGHHGGETKTELWRS